MMRSLILLAMLCYGPTVWAQPPIAKAEAAPKIEIGDKPIVVKVGIPYEIPLQTDATSVQWICFDPKVLFVDQKLLADKRGAIVVVREKGRYRLAVIGSDKQGIQTRKDVWLVAEEEAPEEPVKPIGPSPLVPPPPPPLPLPPVAPISQKLRIIFIEQDSAAVTARTDKIDGPLRAATLGIGHKPLALDRNIIERPPATVKPEELAVYTSYIRAAKSYPWLIVLPLGSGKSLYNGPAPEKDEDFLALLKKYGG